jgi:hypothetical protein
MSHALQLVDYLAPAVAAVVFVALMSLLKEPLRLKLNAVLVVGAAGLYVSGGGFGPWEMIYPVIVTPVAYFALGSYRFIGVGWLMHAGWDLLHHAYGNPLWPFMPSSSFGCLIFDSLIAIWFLAGAPSLRALVARAPAVAGARG